MTHLIVTEKLVVEIRTSVVIKKKFLAYKGDEYTIEWYFEDKGESEVFAYFKSLSTDRQKKLVHLLSLLGDFGKIFNKEKFRHEGNQLYVFKPYSDRFFCFFFEGSKVIVTNAYEKSQQRCRLKKS